MPFPPPFHPSSISGHAPLPPCHLLPPMLHHTVPSSSSSPSSFLSSSSSYFSSTLSPSSSSCPAFPSTLTTLTTITTNQTPQPLHPCVTPQTPSLPHTSNTSFLPHTSATSFLPHTSNTIPASHLKHHLHLTPQTLLSCLTPQPFHPCLTPQPLLSCLTTQTPSLPHNSNTIFTSQLKHHPFPLHLKGNPSLFDSNFIIPVSDMTTFTSHFFTVFAFRLLACHLTTIITTTTTPLPQTNLIQLSLTFSPLPPTPHHSILLPHHLVPLILCHFCLPHHHVITSPSLLLSARHHLSLPPSLTIYIITTSLTTPPQSPFLHSFHFSFTPSFATPPDSGTPIFFTAVDYITSLHLTPFSPSLHSPPPHSV
ncbi:hypothetical protein Pmani_032202 [Petrolisthes manimaculis]|uniref:Uncharacterized protein n=1 Tax=Petrolisthes manimaculis TaxID=1843537 RepID=A0AAE1NT23_9EUCA|nr:hypothetical protein Pmani_032202 [Petrolisthes manimaculis]